MNPSVEKTVSRQARIDEIFDRALDCAAEDVADFLDEACDGDAEIRAKVERLLAWTRRPPTLFEHPAAGGITLRDALAVEETVRAALPERIGPYRILRQIGQGGMGVVYEALRDDGHFEQRLALKVIRPGLETPETLRRFTQERQIIASLQHPNIARLYDGGRTDDGRPFFAMELVEGVPITEYCDEKRLDLNERIRLFRCVADAVHHAHRNLVIHRDLKPSNILVTPAGEVKLLDFGIAKLLSESGDALTQTVVQRMTPRYASPEQIRGESVTTASDVFQLGLLLHALLSGRPAREEAAASPLEARSPAWGLAPIPRMSTGVRRADPDAAAQAAARRNLSVRGLRRHLEGDLDVVVQAALRPEPERRYASAAELAADLQRFQEGFPVSARADSLAYRARRFVHRHRLAVGLAASFLVLLVVYAVTLTAQVRRTAHERDRAEKILSFALGLYSAADPNQAQGPELSARELVAFGAQRVDELGDEPDVQAELYDNLGRASDRLGDYESAEALFGKALEIRRRLLGDEHPDVADSLNALAKVLLERDAPEALPLLQEALAIYRRRHGDQHVETADVLVNLGSFYRSQADYEAAEATSREALNIFRSTSGERSEEVADARSDLAWTLRFLNRPQEAEQHLSEALEIYRALHGDHHSQVATAYNNYAAVLWELERWADGDAAMDASLRIQRALYGDVHADLATSLGVMAGSYFDRGDAGRAAELYEQARAMRQEVYGESHPRVAQSTAQLAEVLAAAGELERAEPLYTKALEIFRDQLPPGHWSIARVLQGQGDLYLGMGRVDDAVAALEDARQVLGEGATSFTAAKVAVVLARCRRLQGRLQDAEALLLQARPLLEDRPDWRARLEDELAALREARDRPAA